MILEVTKTHAAEVTFNEEVAARWNGDAKRYNEPRLAAKHRRITAVAGQKYRFIEETQDGLLKVEPKTRAQMSRYFSGAPGAEVLWLHLDPKHVKALG